MVSLERFMKIFQTFACLGLFFTAAVYAEAITTPEQTTPITECTGYSESRIQCSRVLGDGTTQTASGWCKCSGGMYSGGCTLPAATYTEERGNLSGIQCRNCSISAVTKSCSSLAASVVEPDPSCGACYSCGGGGIEIDPGEPAIPVGDCTSGQVQYRAVDPCGTETRTCCSSLKWSDWGGDCSGAASCSSTQCCNGSKCEIKEVISRACSGNIFAATGGILTRSATCNNGSGWSYGSWTGTCTCKSGYKWDGVGACVIDSGNVSTNCSKTTCPSGQHAVDTIAGCCCEYDNCGKTIYGQMGACRCMAGENTGIVL